MRALQYHSTGNPPVLKILPPPEAGEHLLQADVLASALNHRDIWICQGLYPNLQPDVTLGSDGVAKIAGHLYLINPNIDWGPDQRWPGDNYAILGMPSDGTFADQIILSRDRLVPLPQHLNALTGAALPLAGLTVFRLLFSRCQLKHSDRVCITGIGGGVALLALQFALAAGAEVWVTSGSEAKIQKAVELGASGGEIYTEDRWHKKLAKRSGGFDVIIDSAGGGGFSKLITMANKGARVGIYGGSQGKIDQLSPQIIFWKHLNIYGSSMGSDLEFRQMVQFVTQRQIVPVIDSVFKLDDFQRGFDRMQLRKQFGKIVFDHSD